jgi:hypothetical protein
MAGQRRIIKEGASLLRQTFQIGLSKIAECLVNDTIKEFRNSSPANYVSIPRKISCRGKTPYLTSVKNDMSIVGTDILMLYSKFLGVPFKFEEISNTFKNLPIYARKRIASQAEIITGAQIGDLTKTMLFTFSSAVDETTDEFTLAALMREAGEEYYNGAAIAAGAQVQSAKLVNEVGVEFLKSNSELIDGYVFSNEAPATDICKALEGRVFLETDPDFNTVLPPLHFNAVCSGTLINTFEGNKPIEDLKLGDPVLTHKNRYMPVTEIMTKREYKEYFQIELENGYVLKITGEHPVLTQRGWVPVYELTFHDTLICIEDI